MARFPRRTINEDGTLRCSTCHKDRPLSWFHKDKNSLLGYTYTCRGCRAKALPVEPDWAVVSAAEVTVPEPSPRVPKGAWERVLNHVRLLDSSQAIKILCYNNFLRQYSIAMGLRYSAKRLGIKIHIQHGEGCIYIRNGRAVTPAIKLTGRPDIANWGRPAA